MPRCLEAIVLMVHSVLLSHYESKPLGRIHLAHEAIKNPEIAANADEAYQGKTLDAEAFSML